MLKRQSKVWSMLASGGSMLVFSLKFGMNAGPLYADAVYSNTSSSGALMTTSPDALGMAPPMWCQSRRWLELLTYTQVHICGLLSKHVAPQLHFGSAPA